MQGGRRLTIDAAVHFSRSAVGAVYSAPLRIFLSVLRLVVIVIFFLSKRQHTPPFNSNAPLPTCDTASNGIRAVGDGDVRDSDHNSMCEVEIQLQLKSSMPGAIIVPATLPLATYTKRESNL